MYSIFYDLEKMDVDEQSVTNVTKQTAFTTSNNSSNQTAKTVDDELIVIDPESSESSSSDESDVEVIKQYKLDDVRPVIGNYGKCTIYLFC